MDNNKLIIKSSILALCAAGLMACSAKVESEGGQEPSSKASSKVQALKVQTADESEGAPNELYLVNPKGSMTYYFEYRPKKNERLFFQPGMMVGVNCETANIKEDYRWQEIYGERVITEVPITSVEQSFEVKQGQFYRLQVNLRGLRGCQYLSNSFVIISEETHN